MPGMGSLETPGGFLARCQEEELPPGGEGLQVLHDPLLLGVGDDQGGHAAIPHPQHHRPALANYELNDFCSWSEFSTFHLLLFPSPSGLPAL